MFQIQIAFLWVQYMSHNSVALQSFTVGGTVVSWLVCSSKGLSGPGSSLGWGHCVVLLGKTLYSHSASLHPGAEMGTCEFNAGGNPVVEILVVTSCYENWDKLWPDGSPGSWTDLTYIASQTQLSIPDFQAHSFTFSSKPLCCHTIILSLRLQPVICY